jgi:hypothetical protein
MQKVSTPKYDSQRVIFSSYIILLWVDSLRGFVAPANPQVGFYSTN